MVRRFELEYEFLGRLQHPGIAQIYQAGIADTEYGEDRLDALVQLDADYAAIYRDHHFHRSPDFVGAVKNLLQQRSVKSILDGE